MFEKQNHQFSVFLIQHTIKNTQRTALINMCVYMIVYGTQVIIVILVGFSSNLGQGASIGKNNEKTENMGEFVFIDYSEI